jgi:phosphoglycolate phosphatase-like HAD superfamily hydrolase
MAQALQLAVEKFAAAPHAPALGGEGGRPREEIIRTVKGFETAVAQWRADMLGVQERLTDMYKGLASISMAAAVSQEPTGLDEFIDVVDKEIEAERLALDQSGLSTRQTVATIAKVSSDNARFAKKMLKRVDEAGADQHNARVDFYHFLLRLRAEYNPDYRGGPTFESADDLIADLHKNR